eukprot:3938084-Rhodomonas_salina.1
MAANAARSPASAKTASSAAYTSRSSEPAPARPTASAARALPTGAYSPATAIAHSEAKSSCRSGALPADACVSHAGSSTAKAAPQTHCSSADPSCSASTCKSAGTSHTQGASSSTVLVRLASGACAPSATATATKKWAPAVNSRGARGVGAVLSAALAAGGAGSAFLSTVTSAALIAHFCEAEQGGGGGWEHELALVAGTPGANKSSLRFCVRSAQSKVLIELRMPV